MTDGFEPLVTQSLGRIESNLSNLSDRLTKAEKNFQSLQDEWSALQERTKRIQGPLQDWTQEDSVRLKKLIEAERAGEFSLLKAVEDKKKSDQTVDTIKNRLYLVTLVLTGYIAISGIIGQSPIHILWIYIKTHFL